MKMRLNLKRKLTATSNNGDLLLVTRQGTPCEIDLFASDSNFNGYVIAALEGGKPTFLQYLAYSSHFRGDRVFIMDFDRSYENTCKALNGRLLYLDPKNPISLNPFSVVKTDQELNEELDFLTNFCYSLGANANKEEAQRDDRLIKNYLGNAIKAVYAKKGRNTEITDGQLLIAKEEDQRCKDFARQMSLYCRGGLYEKFFAGKSQIDFSGDFIVAELQLIANGTQIRDPIIMTLIYHLLKSVSGDKSQDRKRLVAIIDEAHKFLGKNARMDDFVEQAYRRFRKEGGSIIIATQGFDDIYVDGKLSRAGAAIVNSSAWKFFLKQEETSIHLLIQSGIFGFSEYEENVMRSIKAKNEIYTITPENFKLPVRLTMKGY